MSAKKNCRMNSTQIFKTRLITESSKLDRIFCIRFRIPFHLKICFGETYRHIWLWFLRLIFEVINHFFRKIIFLSNICVYISAFLHIYSTIFTFPFNYIDLKFKVDSAEESLLRTYFLLCDFEANLFQDSAINLHFITYLSNQLHSIRCKTSNKNVWVISF